MPYTPTVWENKPSTATPLSAANLNKIEIGIKTVTDTVDTGRLSPTGLSGSYLPLTGATTLSGVKKFSDTDGRQVVLGEIGGGLQTRAAGVYPAFAGTKPGVDFANGSSNWRIENDGDTFRVRRADSTDWRLLVDSTLVRVRGPIVTQGYSGSGSPKVRIPFNNDVILDGSQYDATNLANKVGMQNSVLVRGDFSAEASYGAPDPGFVFGANDFVHTSTVSGDLAGVTTLMSRLIELHLDTPNRNINTATGLQIDIGVGSTALNSRITQMTGLLVKAPNRASAATGASVATAYGAIIQSPVLGTAEDQFSLFVEGRAKSFFGGDILMSADPSNTSTLNAYSGTVRGKFLVAGSTSEAASAMLTAKSAADGDVAIWARGRGGQTANITNFGTDAVVRSYFDRRGRFGTLDTSVPADADIPTGAITFYVDATTGAMKLKFKGKDSGGTVRLGEVALA